MKKGMSLAELLLVLAIVGVVAALTIPIMVRNIGDTDRGLYRSAYRLVETVTNDLISDFALYPSGDLDNTYRTNFANKVNTVGTVNLDASSVPGTPNFKTSNGMLWYGFASTNFNTDPLSIQVDINGTNHGTNTAGSDILTIQVYKSGRISVPSSSTEESYLSNT